jgi:hypothetical protein
MLAPGGTVTYMRAGESWIGARYRAPKSKGGAVGITGGDSTGGRIAKKGLRNPTKNALTSAADNAPPITGTTHPVDARDIASSGLMGPP